MNHFIMFMKIKLKRLIKDIIKKFKKEINNNRQT